MYVAAPDTDNVEEAPLQIAVGDADVIKVGNGLTVTVTVAMLEHIPLEPVTEYTVVANGFTTTKEPVKAPGFQV